MLGKVSLIHKKTGAVVPNPQLSRFSRMLARVLCHYSSLRNLTLRLHSLWQAKSRNQAMPT